MSAVSKTFAQMDNFWAFWRNTATFTGRILEKTRRILKFKMALKLAGNGNRETEVVICWAETGIFCHTGSLLGDNRIMGGQLACVREYGSGDKGGRAGMEYNNKPGKRSYGPNHCAVLVSAFSLCVFLKILAPTRSFVTSAVFGVHIGAVPCTHGYIWRQNCESACKGGSCSVSLGNCGPGPVSKGSQFQYVSTRACESTVEF